jgi:5-methylcytosine-specific restriction endonuclease McrA
METKNCMDCGEPKPLQNFESIGWRKGVHRRRAACRSCMKERRAKEVKCSQCGRPNDSDGKTCSHCRTRHKERALADRQAVFQHYGHQCSYCGLADEMFLTVDHVHNDGATHRREIGRQSGSRLCRWLKARRFPPGFQTLCFNCNCAKAIYGEEVVKEKWKLLRLPKSSSNGDSSPT